MSGARGRTWRSAKAVEADNRLADWMAENGGTISAAAAALGLSFATAQLSWTRIRRGLGEQAA